MKENVSCKDCPWCDKKAKRCSINNYPATNSESATCFYINNDYSISNNGLNSFYYNNSLESPKKVKCNNCKYNRKDFTGFCTIDQKFFIKNINFECMYVNEDYSLTREGKKTLIDKRI